MDRKQHQDENSGDYWAMVLSAAEDPDQAGYAEAMVYACDRAEKEEANDRLCNCGSGESWVCCGANSPYCG